MTFNDMVKSRRYGLKKSYGLEYYKDYYNEVIRGCTPDEVATIDWFIDECIKTYINRYNQVINDYNLNQLEMEWGDETEDYVVGYLRKFVASGFDLSIVDGSITQLYNMATSEATNDANSYLKDNTLW